MEKPKNSEHFWTEDSFGAILPDDWEDVIAEANELIETFTGEDDEIREASERLWWRYRHTGIIK